MEEEEEEEGEREEGEKEEEGEREEGGGGRERGTQRKCTPRPPVLKVNLFGYICR